MIPDPASVFSADTIELNMMLRIVKSNVSFCDHSETTLIISTGLAMTIFEL